MSDAARKPGGGVNPDEWYSHYEIGRRWHLGQNNIDKLRQQLEQLATEMADEIERPIKAGNAVIASGRMAVAALGQL